MSECLCVFVWSLTLVQSCHVHGTLEEKADETELWMGPDWVRRWGGEWCKNQKQPKELTMTMLKHRKGRDEGHLDEGPHQQ